MRADAIFEAVKLKLGGDDDDFPKVSDFDCLKMQIANYEENCGKLSDYSLKYVKYLVKACETRGNIELFDLMRLLNAYCSR